MYHAGERHGRAYVWPRMRRGCEWLAMAHGTGDPVVGEAEQMWVVLRCLQLLGGLSEPTARLTAARIYEVEKFGSGPQKPDPC